MSKVMRQLTLTLDVWLELLIPQKNQKKWSEMNLLNLRGWVGFLPAPHLEVWCEEFSQKRIFYFYSHCQEDQGTKLGLLSEVLSTSHSKTDLMASGSFDPGSGLVACGSDRKRLLLFEPSQVQIGCLGRSRSTLWVWGMRSGRWLFASCPPGRMGFLLLFHFMLSALFLFSHLPHLMSTDSSEEVLPSNFCQ